MADKDQMLEDFANSQAQQTEDAIDDLRRIEEETVAEATASVEDYDNMADEEDAAEAAETAQLFEDAEVETMAVEGELIEEAEKEDE
ncbi:MAG: hypothetical protein LUB61_01170 [Eggerthellaceae bacterium]|nr:hypothetical protein [Eggerthellaceae bacterium]